MVVCLLMLLWPTLVTRSVCIDKEWNRVGGVFTSNSQYLYAPLLDMVVMNY